MPDAVVAVLFQILKKCQQRVEIMMGYSLQTTRDAQDHNYIHDGAKDASISIGSIRLGYTFFDIT